MTLDIVLSHPILACDCCLLQLPFDIQRLRTNKGYENVM